MYDGDSGALGYIEGRCDTLVFDRKLNDLHKQMMYMKPLERRQVLMEFCGGMTYERFRFMV